jgi:hypothetical protein
MKNTTPTQDPILLLIQRGKAAEHQGDFATAASSFESAKTLYIEACRECTNREERLGMKKCIDKLTEKIRHATENFVSCPLEQALSTGRPLGFGISGGEA